MVKRAPFAVLLLVLVQISRVTLAQERPASQPAGITRLADADSFIINFKNASIDTVLYELARVSGCTVIMVDRTDHERIGSIVNVEGVSVNEAVTLINVALNDLGYAAIRKGSVLEIRRRADAMTRDIPVMTFTNPYQVPMTDELITAVIPLKSVSAAQLQQELRPLMDAGAVVTSDTSANALIITDVTSSIHRIVAIAHQLDLRSTRATGTRTITLKNARAEDMARMINEMFKESNRGEPVPAANAPAGAALANPGRSGRGRGGAPASQ